MTREEALVKTKKYWEKIDNAREHLLKTLEEVIPDNFKDDDYKEKIKEIIDGSYGLDCNVRFMIASRIKSDDFLLDEAKKIMDKTGIMKDIDIIGEYNTPYYLKERDTMNLYERLVDSDTMHFDGDIIITDPCYVAKKREQDFSTYPTRKDFFKFDNPSEYEDYNKETKVSIDYELASMEYDKAMDKWREDNIEDWDICNCGYDMDALGLRAITHDTIYGDWSCSVFKLNTKRRTRIGEFCADAGMVGVFSKDEVDKYNPEFEAKYISNGCACVVKDFCGDVSIKVLEIVEDGKIYYEARVIGEGINKKTRKPFSFTSLQTGF